MDEREISEAEAKLLAGEALERRFDGPIPEYVSQPLTERAAMIGHHRAMIRFSEVRLGDFAEALAKLKAGPQGPATAVWIARTVAILADHQGEKERHERALDALLREAAPPLAAE
ncbi:MAG: hypothetical protein ACXWML_09600 [Candidatus Binataceae bacterium]